MAIICTYWHLLVVNHRAGHHLRRRRDQKSAKPRHIIGCNQSAKWHTRANLFSPILRQLVKFGLQLMFAVSYSPTQIHAEHPNSITLESIGGIARQSHQCRFGRGIGRQIWLARHRPTCWQY